MEEVQNDVQEQPATGAVPVTHYVLLGDNGKIVQAGCATQMEAIEREAAMMGLPYMLTDEYVTPHEHYLDELQRVCVLPPRPSKEHQFDYVKKEWTVEAAFRMIQFVDLEQAKQWSRSFIDQRAGAARARYITIASGQDATYKAKYDDALAFVRAGYPEDQIDNYPWVKMEADETGRSYREMADYIKQTGDPWNMIVGPKIESTRLGKKTQVDAATEIDQVISITLDARAALDAI